MGQKDCIDRQFRRLVHLANSCQTSDSSLREWRLQEGLVLPDPLGPPGLLIIHSVSARGGRSVTVPLLTCV